MKKQERIERALAGRPVDRIPWSAWYHFGLEHVPGDRFALAELEFYRAYEPDFLKVMNDYVYPLPDGLAGIASFADLARLGPLDPERGAYGEQLKAVAAMARELAGEAHFIDTVFDPWTILRKLSGRDRLTAWMRESPADVKRALEIIARNQAGWVRAALRAGLSGVFYSAGAASPEALSEEAYREFCRPYDLLILEACRGAAMNVLHLHGSSVMFAALRDYPAHAIHWSGSRGRPGLAEARAQHSGCLMSGVDEETATSVTPADIRRQVFDAVEKLGPLGTIVCPGCAFPTNVPRRNVQAIPAALEEIARGV